MSRPRRPAWRANLLCSLLLASATVARADAGWFEAGDTALRIDLQLLNDAEIIRLPINHWPLPRESVRYALENAREQFATNSAVSAALARVRARLGDVAGMRLSSRLVAGQSAVLRDFGTQAREAGELGARAEFTADRFAAGLTLTYAVDRDDDGQSLWLDRSHATAQLGNWLLSAQTLDRWWGPGHQGSLILSSNARPMPTLLVERAAARPFDSSWLRWLGPWRFSFGISQMESEREDIDSPLFMAWRVAVMPFKDIEIGFSRTAQFCGDQLACDLEVFGNLLIGNDNVGIDATAENEPGNQMAGFDIRWASPIGSWPYAVYSQMIGEDESGYLPAKYLSQFGIEAWKPLARGALLQAYIEYSTTTCSAHTNRGPYYNCAYNQGRFDVEGYRYRGHSIGHGADRDAENHAIGLSLSNEDGSLWTTTARRSRFNRDDFGDLRNTVATTPTSYAAIELGWKGRLLGEHVDIDIGIEALEPAGGERDTGAFGFIGWRHEFR
jgi:hypothetical protein